MAVATNAQNMTFPFSMLALNPTECKAIAVSGGGVVEAHANIQSNSSGADCDGDPIGFSRTGGSTINVIAPDATCRAVGEVKDEGAAGSMTCTKAGNSFALPDPLRNLAAPTMPGWPPACIRPGTHRGAGGLLPGCTRPEGTVGVDPAHVRPGRRTPPPRATSRGSYIPACTRAA